MQNRPGTPFRYAAVHEPHTRVVHSVDQSTSTTGSSTSITPALVYTSIVLAEYTPCTAMDQLYYDLERKARIVLHMYNDIYILYILAGGDELLGG